MFTRATFIWFLFSPNNQQFPRSGRREGAHTSLRDRQWLRRKPGCEIGIAGGFFGDASLHGGGHYGSEGASGAKGREAPQGRPGLLALAQLPITFAEIRGFFIRLIPRLQYESVEKRSKLGLARKNGLKHAVTFV